MKVSIWRFLRSIYRRMIFIAEKDIFADKLRGENQGDAFIKTISVLGGVKSKGIIAKGCTDKA